MVAPAIPVREGRRNYVAFRNLAKTLSEINGPPPGASEGPERLALTMADSPKRRRVVRNPDPATGEDGLRFSCTMCGNCCSGPEGYVLIDDDEADVLAKRLQLSLGPFSRAVCTRDKMGISLIQKLSPFGETPGPSRPGRRSPARRCAASMRTVRSNVEPGPSGPASSDRERPGANQAYVPGDRQGDALHRTADSHRATIEM